MSKKSSSVNIPIRTNLIQQNCFLRDITTNSSSSVDSSDSFVSLDEVVGESGIELRETVQPYPITPQYVNSFVDSADYHKDPVNAIATGKGGVNLGDMTELQKVSSMDMESARALYEQLSKKFASVSQPSQPSQSAPQSDKE